MSKQNIYLYEYNYNGQSIGFDIHAVNELEAEKKRMLMSRAELVGKLRFAVWEPKSDNWKYGLAFLIGATAMFFLG